MTQENKFLAQWAERREKIRKETIHILFSELAKNGIQSHFDHAIELGAGDAVQALELKKFCNELVVTEYNKERLNMNAKEHEKGMTYLILDAESDRLPFNDGEFDLVFTSHVLEHLRERHKFLQEARRILKEDGTMIHIMPNRLWKTFNVAGYYPFAAYMLADKDRRKTALEKAKDNTTRDNIKSQNSSIMRKLIPPIHGEYPSHINEFRSFGKKQWIREIESCNLKVKKVIKLNTSSSYRFGFDKIRSIMRNKGMVTEYGFVITKC